MKNYLLCALLLPTGVLANIVTSPNVQTVLPPVNLQIGSLKSNTNVFLIPERAFFVLPDDLTLEILDIGTTYSTSWPGTTSTILAGTMVDVWLLHFNRSGVLLGQQTATVDFGAPILGVAGRSTCLIPNTVCPADTDSYGNPANTYTNIQLLRGLELLVGEDSIRFDTANKITVKGTTSLLTMDEVRIFTLSQVPEPASFAFLAIGLAGLGFARRYSERKKFSKSRF